MQRTRIVEDLAPGDRISIDGITAVVRVQKPHGDNDRLIEFAHATDNRSEMVLAAGTHVDVL